jgi:hypothetical protein
LAPQADRSTERVSGLELRNGPGKLGFATGKATPLGHRNAERRALNSAANRAGLNYGSWPRLRFHALRHTFDVRAQMAGSAFADLLDCGSESEPDGSSVVTLPCPCEGTREKLSAKEKAALRWTTCLELD